MAAPLRFTALQAFFMQGVILAHSLSLPLSFLALICRYFYKNNKTLTGNFYSLQSTFIIISLEHLSSFVRKYKLLPISTDQET